MFVPHGRPLDEIADEITTLSAHLNAATARFLRLIAEFDERQGWGPWGAKSCADWLAWRCSLSIGTAREHVRVAHRLADLPLVGAAFDAGELSFSQARALTRIDQVDKEAELLGLARASTAAQLEQIVRSYRRVGRSKAVKTYRERRLAIIYDEDGSARITGRLSAEEAAVIERALDRAMTELMRTPDSALETEDFGGELDLSDADPADTAAASRIDALVRVCDGFLAGANGTRTGGDRHQVVVHVDASKEAATVVGGGALADSTLERLCCDASVLALLEKDGKPLDVGRKTRSIPPSIRRALDRRDKGCRFPGCPQRLHVDAHHIEHWIDGGKTCVDNLVQLCRHHHTLVHEGGFVVGLDNQRRLVFRTPSGRRLRAAPPPRRGNPGCLADDHSSAGLRIDARTATCGWSGEPLDLPLAVEAMIDIAPLWDAPRT